MRALRYFSLCFSSVNPRGVLRTGADGHDAVGHVDGCRRTAIFVSNSFAKLAEEFVETWFFNNICQ